MLPLIEPTDARYAEIAREMLVSGDWLVPHLNGIPHFHKPPMAYWVTAVGMKLFGVNEFGARAAQYLFAVLTLALVFRMGKRWGGDAGKRAVFILLASPLILIHSALLSADVFLMFFVTAAWSCYFQQSNSKPWLLHLSIALAFLTKGPVAWLWTYLPMGVDRRFRKRDVLCFGVALLLSLSWYLLVCLKHPGLLSYFLNVQLWQRAVSSETFHRAGPFYYYLPLLLAAFLPFIRYWRQIPGAFRGERALLLWALLPLGILSFAASKLPGYLLPALPPFAIALGRAIPGTDRRWWHGGALCAGLLIAGGIGMSRWLPPLPTAWEPALCFSRARRPGDRLVFYRCEPAGMAFYSGVLPDAVVDFKGEGLFMERSLSDRWPNPPFFALTKYDHARGLPERLKKPCQILCQNGRYVLLKIKP